MCIRDSISSEIEQRLTQVQEENVKLRAQVNYFKVQNDVLKSNSDRYDQMLKGYAEKETELQLLQRKLDDVTLKTKEEVRRISSMTGLDVVSLKLQLDEAIKEKRELMDQLNYIKVQNTLLKGNVEKYDQLAKENSVKEAEIQQLTQVVNKQRSNTKGGENLQVDRCRRCSFEVSA
eukprot:TRINITY_DN15951_c0_g1_i1.p1 TRINITY_DN15951_c0_g1~~TRINITY_DN15951_c0_g1_i1.p1  ORF type:complete len:176 (+),score=53.30 TRINITY_DN15951_c0_g1_i1:64-591(+)